VQPADGDHGAACRARSQRWVIDIALPQPRQEIGHVLAADRLDIGLPGRGHGRRVTLQITPVSLQRVLGEAALHGQVVEIPPDSSGDRGQLSTSARVIHGRP